MDEAAVAFDDPPPGHDPPQDTATAEAAVAFDDLMATYGDTIYSLCLRVLRNPIDAEDILQQVFLEAHRDLARFERRSALSTWLFSIAIHRCKDMIKAQRRRHRRLEAADDAVDGVKDPADGPAEQLARRQQLDDLVRCLEGLSSDACLAVLARFKLELSYNEMAVVLNATADTLQTRVTRALPVLRRCMERKGWPSV